METNKALVSQLVLTDRLKTPSLIHAFTTVDRRDFVVASDRDRPYGDFPLSIGVGQTISQPSTVAFMLELLQPQSGEKILDVGSGSGWTTALLAQIVGQTGMVYGVERLPELVALGVKNLAKYNFSKANIVQSGKIMGLPEAAPFDKILVSAAGDQVPRELLQQLKIGGVMVIPIKNSIWQIVKLAESEIKVVKFDGFIFVPLVKD